MPEREVKLGLDPSAPLLDVTHLVDAGVGARLAPARDLQLDNVYYDTADLRLARFGLTLRHRAGEGGPDGVWTLKLPAGQVKGGLSRSEIDELAPLGPVPARLAGLVRAHTRYESLAPVARMRTARRVWPVVDLTGTRLAEIDDDIVDIFEGDLAVRRFREVEVELGPGGDDDLLDRLVGELRGGGVGAPDPTSKLARALGEGVAVPVLPAADLDPQSGVAALVAAAIAAGATRLLAHDPVVRLDNDIEGVHQARVATRRLRSDLRTLRPLVDEGWAEGLRAGLKWLADLLGAVRDADVLGLRLRAQIDGLDGPDRSEALPLLDVVAEERAEAHRALLVALDSPRYLDLLDALVDAGQRPRLRPDATGQAGAVLGDLVAKPWRRLVREVKGLDDHPGDGALHQVRIRAKRARYASELAAPVVGDPAAGLGEALGDLQDELGELHDAGEAERWLRAALARPSLRHRAGTGLSVGLLVAAQRHEATRRRADWPALYAAAHAKRNTRWLS